MRNLIEIRKALHLYFVMCYAWLKKLDNQILLFNVVLISLPLLLLRMYTLLTSAITFGMWCVGITISIIFWRIKINKFKIKEYTNNKLYTVLIAVLLWVAISSIIQAFKCTDMTQTQLFLHIPKSFVCDWEHCN